MTISREEMRTLVLAWEAAPDATHDPRVRKMIGHEVARIEAAFFEAACASAVRRPRPVQEF